MIVVFARQACLAGLVGLVGTIAIAQGVQVVQPSVPPSPPANSDVQAGRWLESSVVYSPFRILAEETAGGDSRDAEPGKADRPREDSRTISKSHVRVRTAIVHPQPSVARATPRYTVAVPSYTDADWSVVAALDKPLPADGVAFENMSLRDLAKLAGASLNCAVRFNAKALEGFDYEQPVFDGRWSGTDYRHALQGTLEACDLGFYVEDGGLVLTTRQAEDEHRYVVFYPLPTDCDPVRLCDHVASVVQPTMWDSVGGIGTIRLMVDANVMLVCTTDRVHAELQRFLRTGFDQDLQPSAGEVQQSQSRATRVHGIRDPKTLRELEASLVGLCNAALGRNGDPSAKAMVSGDKLVVQSSSRPFQVYAAEVVRAIEGVEVVTREVITADDDHAEFDLVPRGMFPTQQGGGFCWVAREVYGSDPRWLLFRDWMLTEAPCWLRTAYAAQGRAFAEWLRTRPVAKSCIRAAMDQAIAGI